MAHWKRFLIMILIAYVKIQLIPPIDILKIDARKFEEMTLWFILMHFIYTLSAYITQNACHQSQEILLQLSCSKPGEATTEFEKKKNHLHQMSLICAEHEAPLGGSK